MAVGVGVGGTNVAVDVLVGGTGVAVGVSVAVGKDNGVAVDATAVLLGTASSTGSEPDSAPQPVNKTTSTMAVSIFLFIYRAPTKISTKAVIPHRKSGFCSASSMMTV